MDGIMTSKLFTTRQGTILLGVIAAVVAAVALIVYLSQYRASVNNNAPVSVLVAKSLIQEGTPGSVIGTSGLYEVVTRPKSDLVTGAFVDPATLVGQVAVRDILPSSQLTAADFGPSTNSVTEQLNPNQRAVSVPLGTPEQVGGQVGAGSHVDVWISGTGSGDKPIVQQLLQNVYVLGTSGGNVTVRTTPQQAGLIIWGSQNAKLWLTLRPTIANDLKRPLVIRRAGG